LTHEPITIYDSFSKSIKDSNPANPPVFPINVPQDVLNPSRPLKIIFLFKAIFEKEIYY